MEQRIQRIPCGSVNAYLLSRGEDAILIDTGRRKHRDRLLAACRPYRMRLLVLTHGHIDHAENAAFLSEALGIPVAMHREDIPLLENNLAQPLEAEGLPGKVVLAVSLGMMRVSHMPPFRPEVLLSEGDSLEGYGVSARVLEVPGHTRGSIAIDAGGRELIVGDALMNMLYPSVSLLYHDREKMEQSATRILGMTGRTIWFGHGKPLKNEDG